MAISNRTGFELQWAVQRPAAAPLLTLPGPPPPMTLILTVTPIADDELPQAIGPEELVTYPPSFVQGALTACMAHRRIKDDKGVACAAVRFDILQAVMALLAEYRKALTEIRELKEAAEKGDEQ